MGSYSELFLKVQLKPSMPDYSFEVLGALLEGMNNQGFDDWPAHDFFSCDRFRYTLTCGSAYHATVQSGLSANPWEKKAILLVSSSLKEYSNEFELFIDWLSPWVEQEPIMGWVHNHDACTLKLIVEGPEGPRFEYVEGDF